MEMKEKIAALKAKKKTMNVPNGSYSKSTSNNTNVRHNNKNVKQFNKSAGRSGDK